MEVSTIEVDIEVIIEITTLEEVEVGLRKDRIQVILEGMIKAVSSRSRSGLRTSTTKDRI